MIAVALTAVRSAGEVALEGVVLGASSRNGLEPALKRAGFQDARIDREAGTLRPAL